MVEGRPVGLSLVAARRADALLMRTALAMEGT
jgi:Asp-tRNA(Asn)/Glu-tRNA(Gln) amidotransferase A subunit family amidase